MCAFLCLFIFLYFFYIYIFIYTFFSSIWVYFYFILFQFIFFNILFDIHPRSTRPSRAQSSSIVGISLCVALIDKSIYPGKSRRYSQDAFAFSADVDPNRIDALSDVRLRVLQVETYRKMVGNFEYLCTDQVGGGGSVALIFSILLLNIFMYDYYYTCPLRYFFSFLSSLLFIAFFNRQVRESGLYVPTARITTSTKHATLYDVLSRTQVVSWQHTRFLLLENSFLS